MSLHEFIYTSKKPDRYYRHIAFWAFQYVFWVFWASVFFCTVQDTVNGFVFNGFLLLEMAYTYFIVYYIYPRASRRKKYRQFILEVLAVSIISLVLFVGYHLKNCKDCPDQRLMIWYFSINFFINGPPVLCAMFLSIKMLKNFYIKMEEKHQLVKENADAELRLLKAQVHPHFLFNTLNNIYSFSLDSSEKARNLLLKLSDTLSYMIYDCEAALVPLDQELKFLSDYIGLEQVRYGERLNLQINITGDPKNKMVAPLLMITFIENSFKHGTSQVLEFPWINLQIQIEDERLCFELKNSKPKYVKDRNPKSIGLRNVEKRLAIIYPAKHQLDIQSTENTFYVKMLVQLQPAPSKLLNLTIQPDSKTFAYA
jgi:hypothetical protein